MSVQNVKGTADFTGKDQQVRTRIQVVLEDVFSTYDFERMDTTILNEMELLASKYGGGEEILKEVYQFSDQGGRSLGLRYDLTLPFAKVLALNPGLGLPCKRFEIGKVFRDGPVKKGRLREFVQCDADIAGVDGPEAEAELLCLAADAFKRLDIKVVIRWNNRRFLAELLLAAGFPEEGCLPVMLTLDKLEKAGIDNVRRELLSKGFEDGPVDTILELVEKNSTAFSYLCQTFGLENSSGAAEVKALQQLITLTGLGEICRFDPFLSRGLSFYTGTVYEIFDATGVYTSSIGAGGRYDAITGRLSGDEELNCSTVGLSFGMEAVAELLKSRQQPVDPAAAVVIPIGNTVAEGVQAASELRQNGIRTRMEYNGRKLKKALASAAAGGIRYAVLIGEDEVRLGQVKLKDLTERTEEAMPLEQAIMIIEKNTSTCLFN
jgi:histidyl-tRNA synthetase